MVNRGNPHTGGYEQAYREIYTVINNEAHQSTCGDGVHGEHGCRPCGVVQEVVEVLMETLAGKLTQEEFYTVATLLARTGTGVRDKEGYVKIDFWGEMNGCGEEGGSDAL